MKAARHPQPNSTPNTQAGPAAKPLPRPAFHVHALRWLLVAIGLACIALLLVPQASLAAFFEHPGRTAANGGEILGATIRGVALLRELAPIAGLALVSLALLADRLLAPTGTPAPVAPLAPATRADALVLTLAMLGAAAIRAPLLSQSLWYDEIAAFLGYSVHGPGVAIANYYTQANHVLQSVLSWASAWAFGVSELSLRLPSFLAGVATVPAVWWLGREAGSPTAARGAAIALALMPVAILESTEARGYAFMALTAALATACFLWARRVRHTAAWGVYAVVCALGVWSHLVTVCVPACHALWCAVAAARATTRDERRNALAGLLAIAVAALLVGALYAPAVPDMLAIRGEFRATDGNEPTLLSVHGVQMLLMLGGAWTWWASLACVPLLAAGFAAAARDRPLRLALALSLGGACLALLAPVVFNSWLYARFLAFALPGVALLTGAGAATLIARPRARALGIACSLVAALAWVASVQVLPPRQPLREGIEFIAAHQGVGDHVLAVGLPDDVHAIYAGGMGVDMQGTGPYGRNLAHMLPIIEPRWVLLLYPRAMPVAVHELLRHSGYAPVLRLPGWIDQGDGEVVVLERVPSAPR